MNVVQGIFRRYGLQIFFDSDNGGGGGGGGNGDQTNWKAKYEELNSQITSGQYVTKESYVTLQRNLETAVKEKQTAAQERDNAQARIALLNDQVEGKDKTLTQVQQQAAQLEAENKAKGAKLERHNVIFKDYPHLAGFEADGLIPDPKEGQKLEDVLTAFSNRMSAISGKALEDFKKTSTPPPPPPKDGGPKGPTEILREANSLLGQGKVKEYEAKMDEYHQAKKQVAS